jgi:regulator of cell morphogenesis and NO signaling
MNQVREKTVRNIAIDNPSTVRVFEQLGIDYCCRGRRSLSEACLDANVPLGRALALLEQASVQLEDAAGGRWKTAPLSDLTAHIVSAHHEFARREIPRVAALLRKVVSRHGGSHPEVGAIEEIFLALARDLATHMLKEEQVLFPFIERMEKDVLAGKPLPPAFFGSVARPIAHMLADHDDTGAALLRLRDLSGGYAAPGDACPTYRALYHALEEFERDIHRHVHLENNLLFPRATDLESKAQLPGDAAR